jgi:hypothetical protein
MTAALIGVLILPGFLFVLAGAAVSTITVEAAPGMPRKRPLTTTAKRAWNATALALVVLGVLLALAGGSATIAAELGLLS